MIKDKNFAEILTEQLEKISVFPSENENFSSTGLFAAPSSTFLPPLKPFVFSISKTSEVQKYYLNHKVKVEPVAKKTPPLESINILPQLKIKDLDTELQKYLENFLHLSAESRKSKNILYWTEFKRAYRRLAKELHPDLNPSGNLAFQQLQKVYETLEPQFKTPKSA